MSPLAIRAAMVAAAGAVLALALGFVFEWSWAIGLWPWPDTPLSHTFLASILAAIALPTLWIAISGELAAVQAGALNLAVTYGATTVYLATLVGDSGQPDLAPHVAVFGAAFVATVAVFLWGRGSAMQDPRPAPAPLRVAFALFAAILVAVGVALVLGEDVFPWPLRQESSVIFGLIFLGAAVYFLHGLARPSRSNAAGQLVGFLAYDLVLIVPFLKRFDEVSGTQLVSLAVYTGVIAISAAIALYYLVIDPSTRFSLKRTEGRDDRHPDRGRPGSGDPHAVGA